MLFLIAKYLSSSSSRRRGGSSSSKNTAAPGDDNRDKTTQRREMPVPAEREREREQGCMAGCVPVAMRGKRSTGASAKVVTVTASSARTSRHGFVRSAASGLFRGAAARGRYFTNHESLPPLPEARAEFAAAFPQYSADAGEEEASAADAIRDAEYPHLARHACLDYTGVNLFSHAQMDSSSSLPSTSSSSSPAWQPPFFDVAYRSATLRSQVEQCDSGNGGIGGAVARRIMASMKMPEEEYVMVCAANRTSAFRLLAESYAFSSSSSGGRNSKKSKKKLLAVYDYESEAVGAMAAAARRRGAEVLHATFAWPSLRLHAADLRKKLLRGRHHQRGLMVFPLVSRMTGARHPYLWMSAAAEQGWHVALDASAMGAKDLDTLGLSLLRPDFVVCNFFKVFGENPSGFAGIFVKKASLAALVDDSPAAAARSIGVVSLVPPRRWSLRDDYSTDLDLSRSFTNPADPDPPPPLQTAEIDITSSFSGPLSATTTAAATGRRTENSENTAEICEEEDAPAPPPPPPPEAEEVAVELRGLDHADSLGLIAIGNRLRCISNWLVIAMQKLKHPHPEDTAIAGGGGGGGQQLVRIYGPRVSFSRGPAVAFNVYDWKGEKVAPGMVQKLADRHAVSLTCGFLRNVSFADKYDADRSAVLERRGGDEGEEVWGIHVVNASLGFLSSFEDAYRLWAFVAKFLDADFVEKERWRYTALNQKTVEV